MNEFNTGKINLEPSEDKQKWYCTLCEDYHTEDKEIYEELFNEKTTCLDVKYNKFIKELPNIFIKEKEND